MSVDFLRVKINKHASSDTKYHCVFGFYFLGLSKAKLSKIYARSPPTIASWINNFEKFGCIERKKADPTSLYRKFTAEKRKWIVDLYKKKPILYLDEAIALYRKEFDEAISAASVSIILHEANLTWKVVERRAIQMSINDVIRFFNELSSINWQLHQLIFLDEVSFDDQDMIRKHGYAVKGQSLIYRGEFNRKKRVSLLCFLNVDGIVDTYCTDGTFDRSKFAFYIRKFALKHSEKCPGKNSVWILDGASIHCHPNIVYYLRELGITPIFLPAYAPFFNPIEVVFGLMKRYLKRENIEDSKANCDVSIAKAVTHFMKKDMRPLFKKCGYVENGRFDPAIGLKQKFDLFE